MIARKVTIRGTFVPAAFLAICLLFCLAKSGLCDSSTKENSYVERLQSRFLSRFFPPKGGWDFSDGTVGAVLLSSGKLEQIKILKHLTNHGKLSSAADSALRLALVNSNPVPPAPPEVSCPVKMTVKFLVISQKHGGYECKVEFDKKQ